MSKQKNGHSNLYILLLLLLAWSTLQTPVTATETSLAPGNAVATITVNSMADNLTVDGACTLREALRAALLNTAWDGCQAGSAAQPDLIVFSQNGTINLTLGEMLISSPVTIQGNGRNQTIIDAGGSNRIFSISDMVKLEAITLQNGSEPSSDGGAINGLAGPADASLELDDVVIQDSVALRGGAIHSDDTLGSITIRNSLLQGNDVTVVGGAIATFEPSEITIISSVIQDNHSENGAGAINCSECDLEIMSSVISDNSTQSAGGGGIYGFKGTIDITQSLIEGNSLLSGQFGGGGVLCVCSLTLTESTIRNNIVNISGDGGGLTGNGNWIIESSTISGNSADQGVEGGIHYFDDGLNPELLLITNSTISSNSAQRGGGFFFDIDASDSVTIRFSTIANNTATGLIDFGGALFVDPPSGPVSLSRNIIDGNVGSPACYPSGDPVSGGYNIVQDSSCGNNPSDQVGVNPMLGALGNNGGETETHPLLPNSPAIDAAPCLGAINVDQRGVPRPQGASCDSGSYEFSTAAFKLSYP